QSKLRGSYQTIETRPGLLLSPGDRVGSLEVVAAPGHTPGQVAFLDARDRTLIAGDAYSTLGGVATAAKMNPRFPLVGFATWDRPTALETARALRALDPARLAVGHGNVVERPGAAMDAAIARAGLSTAAVVAAAAEIADAEGLDRLTLARVAAAAGVRTPSLYNHVES